MPQKDNPISLPSRALCGLYWTIQKIACHGEFSKRSIRKPCTFLNAILAATRRLRIFPDSNQELRRVNGATPLFTASKEGPFPPPPRMALYTPFDAMPTGFLPLCVLYWSIIYQVLNLYPAPVEWHPQSVLGSLPGWNVFRNTVHP